VLFNLASKDAVSGSVDPADESSDECFYSFCRPVGSVHDTVLTPPSKPGRFGPDGESRPGNTRT